MSEPTVGAMSVQMWVWYSRMHGTQADNELFRMLTHAQTECVDHNRVLERLLLQLIIHVQ
eukprot:m.1497141 g.1497141  ORF g.1497141 m.1497141 type:complete len:60 (+) comp25197_c0_seq4:8600-8779(+)